jgi:transcription elongation factor
MVIKYFEPGDLVRIIEGKYKGETGQVIEVEEPKMTIILDASQQEVEIYTNYLKLKSENDSNFIGTLSLK